MSPDNRITPRPEPTINEKKPVQLPKIGPLHPTGWQREVYFYDHGKEFFLKWCGDGNIIVTKEGSDIGISPRRSLWQPISGWELKIFRLEKTTGVEVKTAAKHCKNVTTKEHDLVSNIWEWNKDRDCLREIDTRATAIIELCSEPVAIIPVPEKPHAKLPEDGGGVIVIPIAKLGNEHTVKMLEGFLGPRFQGR